VQDEETPRQLQERTGRHRCINCLADISDEEYFRNDFFCDTCAAQAAAADEEKKEER
jgi:hypothetical protein